MSKEMEVDLKFLDKLAGLIKKHELRQPLYAKETTHGANMSLTMETLIDERKVAEIIKKSVQSLRNDRHKKRGIPYIKLGGSVRYSLGDIHKYIESCRVTHMGKPAAMTHNDTNR